MLIATRQQRGASRGTHRSVGVEVGEAQPLSGKPVNIRGEILRASINAEIAVAEIVGHYDHEVRGLPSGLGRWR